MQPAANGVRSIRVDQHSVPSIVRYLSQDRLHLARPSDDISTGPGSSDPDSTQLIATNLVKAHRVHAGSTLNQDAVAGCRLIELTQGHGQIHRHTVQGTAKIVSDDTCTT